MRLLLRNIKRSYSIPPLEGSEDFDILISSGRVAQIGKGIEASGADVADCSGLSISPGWVDVHVHVFPQLSDIGISPDLIGPQRGVTAMIDAGSSGCRSFSVFRDMVQKTHGFPIYGFLNYGSLGIVRMNVIGDYETDDFIEPGLIKEAVRENREYIKGIKVRACSVVLKGRDISIVRDSKELAAELSLPLMVHVGEPDPELSDILSLLGPGDIVTHCFHGKRGGLLGDDGKVISAAWAAKERGVLFDIGHGCASFSFSVGRKAVAQGFLPDLFGTDSHAASYPFPVVSQAATLSRMIGIGIPPERVIHGVSAASSELVGLASYDKAIIGEPSRFTLFSIAEEEAVYTDSIGNQLLTGLQIKPAYSVIGDSIIPARM